MTEAKRIGYLVSQYPATSHTFIRREIEALRQHGVNIATFSVRRPHDSELVGATDRCEADATSYILPLSIAAVLAAHAWGLAQSPRRYVSALLMALRHRVPGLRALVWSLFHFVEAIVLARRLRAQNVAHLHNHFANSGATVGLLATRYLGLPWTLTLHGISETDYPAGVLLADKIVHAHAVACVSWFGRAQAMRLVPPDQWAKFMIVRCGVDGPALRDLPTAPKRPQGAPLRAICVGRLSPEKGQAGLLGAIRQLRDAGIDVRLTLVGDGPDRALLETTVATAELGNAVTWTGRLDERSTLEAIAGHDVLIVSSFMEGLPVVLMEALALGRPVVAPHVAGIPELVEDGVTGLLFAPGNWDDLARALKRIAAEPDYAAALAAEGHRRVAAEFDVALAVSPLTMIFAADDQDGGPVAVS